MGQPDFGRLAAYPAPPLPHALHDDDADGVVAEGLDDGLPIEHGVQPEPEPEVDPEPSLLLGCRWRVPLTRVLNLRCPPPISRSVRRTNFRSGNYM